MPILLKQLGGGQVLTTTRDSGNAGIIKLNIADNISISGSDPNFESRLARANEFGSFQGGENIVNNQGAESGIFANTEQGSTGDGGSISIGVFKPEGNDLVLDNTKFTERITIANGAKIAADSQGEGNGGRVSIRAEDLTLNNQAEILAETTTFQENQIPSEISLSIEDTLTLRNNSTISAQAIDNADGGNINIDAGFVIAFPSSGNGNDIIANAPEGTGGNITIETEGVLGLEERPATNNNNSNDIDASGETDGVIEIITPDVDALQGVIELPNNIIVPEETVAQACQSDRVAGKSSGLTIKGKGGISPEPTAPFNSDAILVNGQIESNNSQALQAYYPEIKPIKTSMGDIFPARGIIKTEDGRIILTPYPTSHLTSRLPQKIECKHESTEVLSDRQQEQD